MAILKISWPWFESVKDTVAYGIMGLWTVIDAIVYRLVSLFFRLFYSLAEVQLLDNSIYEALANRIYLFIGIIALFALSVSLLKALVNPDEINKGVIKSFKTLITSLALLILMPTIFKYAFSIQGAIIQDDLIGKIFHIDLSEQYSSTSSNEKNMNEMCTFEEGQTFHVEVNDANGNVKSAEDLEITERQCEGNYITMTVLEAFFTPYSNSVTNKYGTTWSNAKEYMIYTGNFNYITTFALQTYDAEEDESISYQIIISTIAGGVIIYLLISFSIDLGIRTVKLAFYQLISPIPVLMKIIPGKEGQFDKWSKATISTFLELFVRILIIDFAVMMCSNLFVIIDGMSEAFGNVSLLAKGILAMGLFAFAKQAPKLLGEALGFEGGNLKFGIKGKLTDTPVLGKGFNKIYETGNKFKGLATGALGAGWTSKMNGGKFGEGAKYGAAKGFIKGGNQFNSQRQGLYSDLGFKGKAGFFGGQAFIDKKTDDIANKYKDEYRDRILPQMVEKHFNKENGDPIYLDAYNNKLSELKTNVESILANAKNSLTKIEGKQNLEINDINKNKQYESYKIEKEKLEEIKDMNNHVNALIKAGDRKSAVEYQKNIMQSINNKYDNKLSELNEKYNQQISNIHSKYANDINKFNQIIEEQNKMLNDKSASRKVIQDINGKPKIVEVEMTQLELKAHEEGVKVLSDANETFKRNNKVYNTRINEKEVEGYKNSLEGQKAAATYAEAMKINEMTGDKLASKMNKDKK